jgi:glucose/arabinose dehydrogenase
MKRDDRQPEPACATRRSRRGTLGVLSACVCMLTFGLGRPADAAIELQLLAGNVPFIVGIEEPGDGSGRLFLVSQAGRILIHDGTHVLPDAFLDISGLVRFDGEQGLLGLAFHPSYPGNGFFYVHYTERSGSTVVARYRVSSNPNVADPLSAATLLTQTQPFTNHKGGRLAFGPDGFLYIALGDGGSGGDPMNNGQRLDTLLGKLLRIDVNSRSPYGIPADNPFVGVPGARAEIWAYGLRNPWRFAFDRETGDLLIADVGQGVWEEIDFQSAAAGGQNYGWRVMEGRHCFNPTINCNPGTLIAPILEYSHSLGCSVTGGFRYRGTLLADQIGTYFFADYCSGRLWGATPDPQGGWTATQWLDTSLSVTTFGESSNGEILLSHYGANGRLYRLMPGASMPLLTVTTSGAGGRVTSSPAALECGTICGVQLSTGTVVTLTATPDPGWTFAGWTGDPDCAGGRVTMTADRHCTAEFGSVFTDDPIVPYSTVVKAVHVVELRSLIDALRMNVGLPPVGWTDPMLIAGIPDIRAAHLIEMRAALNQVYQALGRPVPIYTDRSLAPSSVIRAVHISELRRAALMK